MIETIYGFILGMSFSLVLSAIIHSITTRDRMKRLAEKQEFMLAVQKDLKQFFEVINGKTEIIQEIPKA